MTERKRTGRKLEVLPTLTAAALLLGAPGLAGLAQAQEPAGEAVEPLEYGRELTDSFYAGEVERIVERFSARMTETVGGVAELQAFHQQVGTQIGSEVEVIDEQVGEEDGLHVYQRLALFDRVDGYMTVLWAFDSTGTIEGFYVGQAGAAPAAESRFLDYETQAQLRLPFEGEWTVFWGGREVEQNYHAAYADQRFALDVVIVEDGSTFSGDGSVNEDYYCFGQPILAPAAGTVVVASDGAPDNVPGEMDGVNPPGNHVVIDHGNDEYSFLAHLQQGSVRVAAGDRVESGDVVGLCGNSGNSSEAHLHYHLQNTPDFGEGEGLPAQFADYIADGEHVERGEPLQGQVIEPAQ